MSPTRVITWNVLHWVHGVNWGEAALRQFPLEQARIAAISALVLGWVSPSPAGGPTVVCLQEVSGDQLASLRSATARFGLQLFDHVHPRLPRLRGGGKPVLADSTEHLVTLVAGPAASLVEARAFDTDPGKGFLAVATGAGVLLFNAHVTFGGKRVAQLAFLAEKARAASSAVVLGDFNAGAAAVGAGLGPGFVTADLRGQPPTRCPAEGQAGQTIDHIAALGCTLATAAVLDAGGLSDHAPVCAVLGPLEFL